jgi:hypothetical protein
MDGSQMASCVIAFIFSIFPSQPVLYHNVAMALKQIPPIRTVTLPHRDGSHKDNFDKSLRLLTVTKVDFSQIRDFSILMVRDFIAQSADCASITTSCKYIMNTIFVL